jgi:hypothetical protein
MKRLHNILLLAAISRDVTGFHIQPSQRVRNRPNTFDQRNVKSIADSGVIHGIFRPLYPSETTTALFETNLPRRGLLGGLLAAGGLLGGTKQNNAAPTMQASKDSTKVKPILDVPMIRLQLPEAGLGREYVAIQLDIQGKGPFEFMIDSGLTTEMITPNLQNKLGLNSGGRFQGFAAGGATENDLVDLDGALLCTSFDETSDCVSLPKLHAVVTDFPQEHVDPKHDVEGMLGMELLSMYDVDLDFPNRRVRFWEPGTMTTATNPDMVEIPAVVINETGLLGIRVTVPGGKQPILGFIDCGSTFSCMNWKAAKALDFPDPKTDSAEYRKGPAISAIGIDGKPLILPTYKSTLSYAGEPKLDPSTKRPIGFASPPSEWNEWNPVQLAIGDLPVFSSILGDGIKPFDGPAALIGLDILSQRRVILGAGDRTKKPTRVRRLLVSPKG